MIIIIIKEYTYQNAVVCKFEVNPDVGRLYDG